jgi:hypothetical protein
VSVFAGLQVPAIRPVALLLPELSPEHRAGQEHQLALEPRPGAVRAHLLGLGRQGSAAELKYQLESETVIELQGVAAKPEHQLQLEPMHLRVPVPVRRAEPRGWQELQPGP